MTDILIFIMIALVVIKALQYGIWTFCSKNIPGGIFITCLSVSTLSLAAYILLFGGA